MSKRLICFGDSITARETFENGAYRLTPRLRIALSDWEVLNAGISGNNTRDAVARIYDDVLSFNPDLVIVLLGANDTASHKRIDITEYRANLLQITNLITPQKAVLVSPSPVDENRPRNRTNIDIKRYCEVVEDVAHTTGSQFINLFFHMIAHPGYISFLSDGLHFNESGYEFLSDFLFSHIVLLCRQNGRQY